MIPLTPPFSLARANRPSHRHFGTFKPEGLYRRRAGASLTAIPLPNFHITQSVAVWPIYALFHTPGYGDSSEGEERGICRVGKPVRPDRAIGRLQAVPDHDFEPDRWETVAAEFLVSHDHLIFKDDGGAGTNLELSIEHPLVGEGGRRAAGSNAGRDDPIRIEDDQPHFFLRGDRAVRASEISASISASVSWSRPVSVASCRSRRRVARAMARCSSRS